MALTTLRPDSTISSSECRDESGGTTNLHDALNEVTPSDATYTHTLHNAGDANCHLGLDNLPTDADNTQPISTTNAIAYTIRVRNFQGTAQSNDTITLHAQIFSSADVAYTNQVLIRDYNDNSGTSAFADVTGTFTTQTAGLNASEADWNSAKIVFTWTYIKTAKADPVDIDISNVELDVTYDQAVAAAVLTLPIETNIGQTTATIGCTTDTAAGTLYWYVSTSATPPSAAEIKSPTVAVDSGNVTTPGVGTETFNVTGLTLSTNYYSYFLQDNGSDSNMLESGIWTTDPAQTDSETFAITVDKDQSNLATYPKASSFDVTADENFTSLKNAIAAIDYNTQLEKALAQYKITSESISLLTNLDYNASVSFQEALSFILSLAQEESNNKTSNLNIDLQGTLDFLFSNLLTGAKSITLGTLLDTIIATNKITAESQSFDTTLDFDAIGGKSVAGTSTFGINTTYSVNNYKAILAQMNVDIVLSDEESISKILAEAISFSYTLTFAEDLTGVGILDDPIYSAGNYIFVDLANVLASGTGVITGSITFTTQLGEEKSIGLVGQAAVTLLTQLAEQSSAAKLTTEAETFAISLDQSLDFARLLSFSAGLDLEVLPTASTNALKSIVYAISNDISVSNVKETDKVLTFTTQLNEQLLKQLTSNLSIDFSTSLDHVLAVQADLNNAITFLTELDVAYRSGEDEFVTFTVNMLKTEQVQQILNPTLTLLTNLTQVEQKAVITSETITFLSNLLTEQAGNVGIFGVITLAAQFEQIETKTLTIDKAFELIINLADNVGIQLDKVETITLLLQLADTFDNVRSKPASLLFNTSLDMSATNLLDKLAAIALLSTFDQNQEVQIDFNVAITFANILSELMIGNATGAIDAVISFAVQMQKDNVGISTLFDNISFESLADLTGVAGRDLLESISITAQFDELGEYTLSQDGAVTFQTFYNKLDATRMDYRPSIDFDLQAIETSTNNKNTLATMLLGIESDLITESNRTLPIIINYGLTQNLETDISLVAEGTVTMTTAMEESSTLQMLGQAGITFGHILGLSALANADMAKSISFGTITDFAVEGFTLQFTVSTPEGRVLKIYFEDRITIVDEENRVVKVYKKPSTIIN